MLLALPSNILVVGWLSLVLRSGKDFQSMGMLIDGITKRSREGLLERFLLE